MFKTSRCVHYCVRRGRVKEICLLCLQETRDLWRHLSTCLLVYLSTYLPVYLFTCRSVELFICLHFYLSTCLPVDLYCLQETGDLRRHLSTCLLVYLSTCLSVNISTCLRFLSFKAFKFKSRINIRYCMQEWRVDTF